MELVYKESLDSELPEVQEKRLEISPHKADVVDKSPQKFFEHDRKMYSHRKSDLDYSNHLPEIQRSSRIDTSDSKVTKARNSGSAISQTIGIP